VRAAATLAAGVVVLELAGALLFALSGSWLGAVLLVVGAALVFALTRAALARLRPDRPVSVVERERIGW